jgi:glutaminyl-tRNA synthetase
VTFSRNLWIEREDFMQEPIKKYFRMFPGNEVRLKTAYVVRCTGCKTDSNGNVTEVLAQYDPATRGGNTPDGRKVRGTIHWLDADTAIPAEVRLYDNLFTVPEPEQENFLELLNPNSLEILTECKVEPSMMQAKAPAFFQFMRQGYFCLDQDSTQDHLIFNRSVSLKDSFKKKN